MKTCSYQGCSRPCFGGGYCAYHQFVRRKKGGDLYKPKPRKSSAIPKESKKQKKVHQTYLQRLSAFWDRSVEEKTDFCFFCGVHMDKRDNIHHLRGRGKMALEEEFWVNAHNECHLNFHFKSVAWLKQQDYYESFMIRLRAKDLTSYYKQIRREEKNLELF